MNLLDLIFPKKCLECGEYGKYICVNCIKKVRNGGWFGNNLALFKYEGVIRKSIMSLKYKFAYDVSYELADVCVSTLDSRFHIPNSVVLVPIPLHKYRYNFRGFNQAEIIGEKIANKMGWKYVPDLLIRTKNTSQQVGQKRSDRIKNLSDVFVVNTNHFISNNYSLVLFDDVYTTGTTINEAIKVLKSAGFKNIKSLTIARG